MSNQNELKKAIKKAITENNPKWKVVKVWSVSVSRSYMDVEKGKGQMDIAIMVKLK